MASLGIGIVGLGFMGKIHLAAFWRAAEAGWPCRVVALCDRDPARKLDPATRGNLDIPADARPRLPDDVRLYDDFAELLDDDRVHAVSICTWTDTHVDLAIQALRTGRHVLLEKPLARSVAEARPLLEAAQTSKPICMPAMCMRFWPGWSWLLEHTTAGTFGPLRALTLTRISSMPNWSAFYADRSRSGGALLDLHVHDTDFVAALCGTPREVRTAGRDDHVVTTYLFDHAPDVALAEGCWDAAAGYPFRMAYRAHFDEATAEYDGWHDPPLRLARGGAFEPVELPGGTGYDHEIRHFVEAATGRCPPRLTVRDAVASLAILEAERRSLRTSAPVALR